MVFIIRKFDPEFHHRRSIRLQTRDYSMQGMYFVTIRINSNYPGIILSTIKGNRIQLSDFGRIICDEWNKTREIRQNVELDEYIIMPDHFHAIIKIVGARHRLAPIDPPGLFDHPGARHRLAPTDPPGLFDHPGARHRLAPTTGMENEMQKTMKCMGVESGSLGAIIGQFKSITTKRVNKFTGMAGISIWQRNYYEHIIRNEVSLTLIRNYIRTNPIRYYKTKYP